MNKKNIYTSYTTRKVLQQKSWKLKFHTRNIHLRVSEGMRGNCVYRVKTISKSCSMFDSSLISNNSEYFLSVLSKARNMLRSLWRRIYFIAIRKWSDVPVKHHSTPILFTASVGTAVDWASYRFSTDIIGKNTAELKSGCPFFFSRHRQPAHFGIPASETETINLWVSSGF